LPTLDTSPKYLAPTNQEFFAWPKWGQYYQSGGELGEAPTSDAANRLLAMANGWNLAKTDEDRRIFWTEMLRIHAEQQYGVGLLSEAPQPVVVSKHLRNVPERAIWAFEPGAHFGIHRVDEFFFDAERRGVSQ
jgi:peptide/nickel transport system substrate-binding protein